MVENSGVDDTDDRPESGSEEYRNPWPTTTRGKIALAYFAGLSILYFFVLPTVGSVPTRILGFPVLVWLTVLIYLSYAGGMYVLIYRPEVHDRRGAGA